MAWWSAALALAVSEARLARAAGGMAAVRSTSRQRSGTAEGGVHGLSAWGEQQRTKA